jgi:hypothetical protein
LWLFAILAAAAAPVCVRAYASVLQKRARTRTERALSLADRDEVTLGRGLGRGEQTKDAGGCSS